MDRVPEEFHNAAYLWGRRRSDGMNLKLRVGDEVATLTLFEEKAPKICARIRESLPLKSSAIIAKVAGLELMMRVPFILDDDPENQVTRQEAGNVAYWHFSQNVCVFCEELPGLGPVSLFGRITENFEGIRREALKCKQSQGAVMMLYAEG
jgi:hypothetical protein